METLHVAAAIIENDKKEVLAARRADIEGENAWEFPGGKVEAGESAEEALAREVAEELGCRLQMVLPFDTIERDCDGFHLTMDVFVCTLAPASAPEPLEHAELAWVNKDQLTEVAWLDADKEAALKLGMFWDMFFEEEHL